MYIIPGYKRLDHTSYVSSNAEWDIGAWDAETTYVQGNLCKVDDVVYECSVGPAKNIAGQYCSAQYGVDLPNVGNNPALNPTVPAMDRTAYPDYKDIDDCYEESGKLWWIRRGPYWENQYRMFDEQPDLVTLGPSSTGISVLEVVLKSPESFNTIGFVRTEATSLQYLGPIRPTLDPDSGSSSEDYFEPVPNQPRVTVIDGGLELDLCISPDLALPGADIYKNSFLNLGGFCLANEEFTLRFIHDNSRRQMRPIYNTSASVGVVLPGFLINVGMSLYDSSTGIQDFSKKERDAFGRIAIVPRTYTNKINFKVACDTNRIFMIKEFFASFRALLTLYTVSDVDFDFVVAGYFKDFSIPIDSYTQSIFNLEVEGL